MCDCGWMKEGELLPPLPLLGAEGKLIFSKSREPAAHRAKL